MRLHRVASVECTGNDTNLLTNTNSENNVLYYERPTSIISELAFILRKMLGIQKIIVETRFLGILENSRKISDSSNPNVILGTLAFFLGT